MQIEEILRRYGVQFRRSGEHRHVRGGWLGVDCPRCGPNSGKFHAGISPNGRAAICWRCGKLRLDELLADLTRQSIAKARSWISSRTSSNEQKDRPAGGILRIPKGVVDLQRPHRSYLRLRGFDPYELEAKWGIKGIGLSSELPWRVFIPIEFHGKVVSWTTRAISDDVELRYISAREDQEAMHHRHILFGADYANHSVVVFEGPFAVFRVGYGAVATLGVGYSKEQVLALSRYPKRHICFDAGSKAQERAAKLCADLECFPGLTQRIELETGKSADDAADWELEKIRELLS